MGNKQSKKQKEHKTDQSNQKSNSFEKQNKSQEVNNETDQKKQTVNSIEKDETDNRVNNAFHAEDTQKKIVYGFIRNCQQLLPQNKPYFNIPKSLYNICFKYYFIQFGEWIKPEYDARNFKISSNNLQLNTNDTINLARGGVWTTVEGIVAVDGIKYPNSIYEWELKIIRIDPGIMG